MAEELWSNGKFLVLFHQELQRNILLSVHLYLFYLCIVKTRANVDNVRSSLKNTKPNRSKQVWEKKILFIKSTWLSMEEYKIINLMCLNLFSIHTKTWKPKLLYYIISFEVQMLIEISQNVFLKACVLRCYRSFFFFFLCTWIQVYLIFPKASISGVGKVVLPWSSFLVLHVLMFTT